MKDALILLPCIRAEHLPAALTRISIADPLATCKSISIGPQIATLSPHMVVHALGCLVVPGTPLAIRENLTCFFQHAIHAGNQDPLVHELHMMLMVLSARDADLKQ